MPWEAWVLVLYFLSDFGVAFKYWYGEDWIQFTFGGVVFIFLTHIIAIVCIARLAT